MQDDIQDGSISLCTWRKRASLELNLDHHAFLPYLTIPPIGQERHAVGLC